MRLHKPACHRVFRQIKERRRKTVALPPELVAIVKNRREAQVLEREAAANLWQDHGVVFAQPNGRPIDPRTDWQEWSDILADPGIQHASTHTMRHSAAIALDEGIAWLWFRKRSATPMSLGYEPNDIRLGRLSRLGASRRPSRPLGERRQCLRPSR